MEALKLLMLYKADKYQNKVSPERKRILDNQVDDAIEEHIQELEELISDICTCWVGVHDYSRVKRLRGQIEEIRECQAETKENVQDIAKWRHE